MVKGNYTKWRACFRTVILEGSPLVLSYRNNIIAAALDLFTSGIIILDAITGIISAVLSGHTSWIRSLVFSIDGRLLVSGGDDKTVKLWDLQTGGVIKTFYGNTCPVESVSISANCTKVASASSDWRICLWDIQTGECYSTLRLKGQVNYVSFSHTNPGNLISIPGDKVEQWDINVHQTEPTYNGSQIAFSPDQTQFALYDGDAVMVHTTDSGTLVAELDPPSTDLTQCCCFSPDNRFVAIASEEIVNVWDIISSVPLLVATFAGHVGNVTTLAFTSPSSIISASDDRSIKFWKINTLSMDSAETDPKSTLITPASIQFVSLQAKEGVAISGDSDGVVKVWDILTGLCKTSFETPAREIYWGDAQLLDGRLLFIWCRGWNNGICIWNSGGGQYHQTLDSLESFGLRISGDGSKVFVANLSKSAKKIQAWSIWMWKLVGEVELDLGVECALDSFHAEGSKVWIQSGDLMVRGWDFGVSGPSPTPLSSSSSERPYLDFINGTFWENGPSFVKNTVTGQGVFKLSGKYARPQSAKWDGQYLVAGYTNGEVLILDFNTCINKNFYHAFL